METCKTDETEIHPKKKYDDFGRLYGRSRNTKKYQLSCKRLSRRKSRINMRKMKRNQENIREERTCKNFTTITKLKVLKECEHASVSEISQNYNITEQTVRNWKKNKLQLEELGGSERKLQQMKRVKTTLEALDKALYIWFHETRSRRIPITGNIIKAKALELFNEMNLQDNFTASNGWIGKWKIRHGIRDLHADKEMCVDTEAAYKFKIELSQKIKDENITLAQIFNVSKTGLYFRMLPVKTVTEKEECQAPGFKQNEDYMTIMLCSNADGSLKLPLVVIGKHEKPRLHLFPIYYAHESSEWMDNNIFETWFKSEFVPRVTSFLQEKNLPIKAVLLFDDTLWHPSVETLSVNDITAYDLPRNTTALIQPMNQGIIESLKRRYRGKLLCSSLFLNEQKGNIDAITYLKSLTIRNAVYWLINAWNEVTTNTIFKSWRNILSVECFEHETEDLLLEPTDQDLLYFLHQIKNYENVTQDAVRKWILKTDSIFPELPSNKEIIDIAIASDKHENENENIKEELKEEEEEIIDSACALSAAKILLSFVEKNGLLENEEELALLLGIKDRIITMNIAQ